MFRKLPLYFTLFCALAITGCNDDDPVNDTGIADVIEFNIDDYTEITGSTDLAGVWVAVGTGTFERDDSGDRKYGEQSAKIYFLITGSQAGGYKYANCFDEGSLEEGFAQGDFETLNINGSTIEFDAVNSDGDLLSDDDDTNNTGTITDNVEINTVFTFDDGDSKEVNTFQIRKVSNDATTFLGTSNFKETSKVSIADEVACFAQWSGSYSTSDGYYTVERFYASFDESDYPFSAAEYMSDDEDISEYLTLSYNGDVTPASTKDSDTVNFFYSLYTLYFSSQNSGTSIDKAGTIEIDTDRLE